MRDQNIDKLVSGKAISSLVVQDLRQDVALSISTMMAADVLLKPEAHQPEGGHRKVDALRYQYFGRDTCRLGEGLLQAHIAARPIQG